VTDIDLTVNWENGTLEQILAELPDKMMQAGLEAIDEGADFMRDMARILVLKDTRSLEKSIRKQRKANTVIVRAGGYITNPKTGKLVNYAHWQEMMSPYMRPAFQMVRKFIRDKIKQNVTEAIQT